MKLSVGAQTDAGMVRSNNEDNFFIAPEMGLLVVADGMGGHASGEVASKMAIDVIKDYFDGLSSGQEKLIGTYHEDFSRATNRIASALRLANMAVYEASMSAPQWHGMGTTLACVFVENNRLSIAHVGDSRVYLIRAGEIEQLTDDHSLVYEQVKRDLITKEQAEKSEMKNILTRAIGTSPDVGVDIDEMNISDGDILLLCTDGLTGMVLDDQILSVVTQTRDPHEACDSLIRLANENGGLDNVTVITAYVVKERWFSSLVNFLKRFRR
ncbi:MAG: Stp1/IreP family PP2C-type Ser/Thr phosphatase [Deltaproteobacteria bacterium]|nr:Stp1/IreP family PP2C-type Ser/Thr phosphatase [Deltaproteobacteria bacterium]